MAYQVTAYMKYKDRGFKCKLGGNYETYEDAASDAVSYALVAYGRRVDPKNVFTTQFKVQGEGYLMFDLIEGDSTCTN